MSMIGSIIRSIRKPTPFERAIEWASTGDDKFVSLAPSGIETASQRLTHVTGVLLRIGDRVLINNSHVTTVEESRGVGFYPYYGGVLVHTEVDGQTHQFKLMCPPDGSKAAWVDPKICFNCISRDLVVHPLPSGKGVLLFIGNPCQEVLRLENPRFVGFSRKGIADKKVPANWKGPHTDCIPTPHSVIFSKQTLEGGVVTTQFFRGHHKRRLIHTCIGKVPSEMYATDDDLFYKKEEKVPDGDGEKGVVVSVKTGKTILVGQDDELFPTSKALVRISGNAAPLGGLTGVRVEVNGTVIARDLKMQWRLAHPDGILYGRDNEIRMLVVKDVR